MHFVSRGKFALMVSTAPLAYNTKSRPVYVKFCKWNEAEVGESEYWLRRRRGTQQRQNSTSSDKIQYRYLWPVYQGSMYTSIRSVTSKAHLSLCMIDGAYIFHNLMIRQDEIDFYYSSWSASFSWHEFTPNSNCAMRTHTSGLWFSLILVIL